MLQKCLFAHNLQINISLIPHTTLHYLRCYKFHLTKYKLWLSILQSKLTNLNLIWFLMNSVDYAPLWLSILGTGCEGIFRHVNTVHTYTHTQRGKYTIMVLFQSVLCWRTECFVLSYCHNIAYNTSYNLHCNLLNIRFWCIFVFMFGLKVQRCHI